MAHNVKLTINNQSGSTLFLDDVWFWKGGLDTTEFFPLQIPNNVSIRVDSSGSEHCSGYVSYITGNSRITIGFSNPSSGSNKLGVGLTGKDVWENMTNNDYKPFEKQLTLNDSSIVVCKCICTGSDINNALVTLVGASIVKSESYFPPGQDNSLSKATFDDLKCYFPVGWMPYLGDWKNYIASGQFRFSYYDPSEIDGVGVLTGVFDGRLTGVDLKSKTCIYLNEYEESEGHYSWVLLPVSNNEYTILYVWNSQLQINNKSYTRHSALGSGKPVVVAGEFYIRRGQLKKLYLEFNNVSGHYKPDFDCLKYVIKAFNDINVNTKDIEVYIRQDVN